MSSLRQEGGEVGRIYRDRVFQAMAPLLALTAGSHVAIQTLWVGPWLRDVAGLDRDGTAYSLFIMAAAFFVGIPAYALLRDLDGAFLRPEDLPRRPDFEAVERRLAERERTLRDLQRDLVEERKLVEEWRGGQRTSR